VQQEDYAFDATPLVSRVQSLQEVLLFHIYPFCDGPAAAMGAPRLELPQAN
jgi:hypothetical protein